METIEILRNYPNCKVKDEFKEVLTFQLTCEGLLLSDGCWMKGVGNLTPILRPMSSMTEEEKRNWRWYLTEICDYYYSGDEELYHEVDVTKQGYLSSMFSKATDYLRSINIDIDNLIESGKAESEEGGK